MWRYTIIIIISIPILVLYTLYRAIKFKDLRYFYQRLGLIKFQLDNSQFKPQNNHIWIHAASIGEVYASRPLIDEINVKHKNITILITTNTSTAARIVTQEFPVNVQHYYMPYDWKWAINRIFNTIRPKCLLIIETEIWPNLYRLAHRKNIPVIIINARLSYRTLSSQTWLQKIYKNIIQIPSQILTRSNEESDNYRKLGAREDQLKMIGNIKYSTLKIKNIKSISIDRPYVLAASTHNDEESQLGLLWLKLIEQNLINNQILVIVPRHPERGASIEQQLNKMKLTTALRSQNHSINKNTQIYIADTIGELKAFMIDAKFIFIGGSLISHGGQNIIEPAQLGKAIIFGHSIYNFKTESQLLLDNNAAIQVNNSEQLFSIFKKLITQEKSVTQLEKSIIKLMVKNNSIAKSYYNEIKKYLKF